MYRISSDFRPIQVFLEAFSTQNRVASHPTPEARGKARRDN